jgi:hypothetical protein
MIAAPGWRGPFRHRNYRLFWGGQLVSLAGTWMQSIAQAWLITELTPDPVWLGVMIGVNLQTSFLTPPFGFALFYLRGVASRLVTTAHIYRGIIPFVAIQVLMLFLLVAEPRLGTWLPDLIYRSAPQLPEGERKPDDFAPGAESESYSSDEEI